MAAAPEKQSRALRFLLGRWWSLGPKVASPDSSPPNDTLEELGKGGALQAAEKLVPADNHPVAQSATPPESGGELLKRLPSSDEEGWRFERRGGCNRGTSKRQGLFPQPLQPRRRWKRVPCGPLGPEARLLQRLKPPNSARACGGAEAPPFHAI